MLSTIALLKYILCIGTCFEAEFLSLLFYLPAAATQVKSMKKLHANTLINGTKAHKGQFRINFVRTHIARAN